MHCGSVWAGRLPCTQAEQSLLFPDDIYSHACSWKVRIPRSMPPWSTTTDGYVQHPSPCKARLSHYADCCVLRIVSTVCCGLSCAEDCLYCICR